MRYFTYVFILTISTLIPTSLKAQEVADQNSIANALKQDIDRMAEEFSEDVNYYTPEYAEYIANMHEEHRQFQQHIENKWGEAAAIESTPKQWVEYSDNNSARSIVDFESGRVKIEVLLSKDDLDKDGNVINEKLQQALANALQSKGHTTDYDSKYMPRSEVGHSSILSNMVDLSGYGVDLSLLDIPKPGSVAPVAPTIGTEDVLDLTPRPTTSTQSQGESMVSDRKSTETLAEAKAVAEDVIESVTPVIEQRTEADGSNMIVASLELELVSDHISQNAAKYSKIISKHAERFSIDEPVIYAIMEQESSFNPMAKSWVPAYGLMQLVPSSGGLDAYRYVYKADKIVSGEYLFVPDQNIELGTAYLRVLYSNNFSKVTDPQCQRLCVIAAYNCGAGNVSRAIIGSTNLPKAIPEINKMNYDQLYDHFRTHLPNETKDYILKITRNIAKYTK